MTTQLPTVRIDGRNFEPREAQTLELPHDLCIAPFAGTTVREEFAASQMTADAEPNKAATVRVVRKSSCLWRLSLTVPPPENGV